MWSNFLRLRSNVMQACLAAVFCGLLSLNAWSAEAQTLQGHVPAAVARLAPMGVLDGATQMSLAIGLPSRDQVGLNQFLHELYDPTSPSYRKFLTPAEFAANFGPTEEDYQAVIKFAEANGLTVSKKHSNRILLDVKGSVANIQNALHVTLRTYQHPTEARQFFAPDREPSLDLAVPLLHISGLDNYSLPHTNLKPIPGGLAAKAAQAGPRAGSAPGGTYAGNDFRAAYVPGTSLNGAGQNVALLQFDGYDPNDIAAYETAFNLPNVSLVNVPIDGGVPTPGKNNDEVCLDIEMVISMAPGVSTIYVYEAPNPSPWVDLLNQMAEDNFAKQIGCSWGGGGPNSSAELIFQEMSGQGQSFLCASGDSDAFTGDVPFPAESPNITMVGGTTLTTAGPGGAFVSEKVWNAGGGEGSSGGISPTYSIPTWQKGVSMANNQGSTTQRNIPDVAMTADNVYVLFNSGSAGDFGGTSCAAPLWAGFTALVNQQAASYGVPPPGFLNPAIYAIGTGANYNSDFNDVTVGNNFWSSSPSLFSAVTGYDLCTGWGSPVGGGLIPALGGPFVPTVASFTPVAGNPGTSVIITGTNFYGVTAVAFRGTNATTFTVNSATQITATVPQGASTGPISVTTLGGTGTSSDRFTVHGPTDATLSALTLSPGVLAPTFDSATTNYTATVSNATASTTVTATPYNPNATVTGNIGSQPLAVGDNTLSILVTAADAVTTQTYTVVAHRKSADATLSTLTLSGIILNPLFSSGTTSYTASVPYTTSSTLVTATQNNAYATVTGATGTLALAVGANTLNITVTAEDGNSETYSVVITRAPPSMNPNLSGLVLSKGTLSPMFSGTTTSYTATVPNAQSTVYVTPTAVDAVTTVQVDGLTVPSGTPSTAVSLAIGDTIITVMCTAQDGVHTITYSITVHRDSADATLSSLKLSAGTLTPAFSSGITSYTASVPYTTNSTLVTATANSAAASVSGNLGSQALAVGANTLNILVTAENGNTETYSVVVTRVAASNDATLSSLVPSAGTLSPAFSSLTTSYAESVPGTTTSLTLTPTANQANATITVNGVTVLSGNASNTLNLNLGANTENVVVTAQDGVTVKTYTVKVTRLTTPDVTTVTQTNLTATAVTLNGTVVANGTSTTASFKYGPTASYGSTIAATPATVTGQSTTTISANLTGLKPLTNYHYQAQGVNTGGTGTGLDMNFTTPNNVATLSGLVLSSGPLTPVFKSTTTAYTATVSNSTASVTLTPSVTDTNATVTVDGVTTLSGSASAPINLNAGPNPIPVVVTAQDGITKKTYTVNVTRTALLATMTTTAATSLGTTTATLNGTVVANNGNTTLSFDYGTSTSYGKSIAATPSTANGTTSTSFSATPTGLTPGTLYHFRAEGVNAAGTANGTDQTFTTISNVAKLSGLKLSNGTLSPAFSSGTKTYAATVANTVTSLTVTPTATNSHATVTVNSVTVTSGTASGPVTLAPGPNTITVVSTAQDGVTVLTYTVNVTRTTPRPVVVTGAATSIGSTSAVLNGTVNASNTSTTPSFEYGLTTSYGSTVAATPSPLTGSTVTAVSATAPNLLPAKTYHYRIDAVNVGGASSGADATFTTPNNVATLSNLVLSTGAMDQTFSPATTTYTQTVSSSTTSLTVTPTVTANSHATVTVNAVAVTSGSKSAAQTLVTGPNTINVVVTAQNGTTATTYTITVTVPVAPGVVQADGQPVTPLLSGAPVPIKAQLIGPVANGGVLPGATVTFAWNAGRSASAYSLSVGRTEGGTDLYNGVQGLALSHTLTLPTDGANLYVTLSSMINGAWLANNYLFSAADTTVKAVLLTPADQSVLAAATPTFTWGTVPGAKSYWLSIGSTEDGTDLYDASQGLALTQNVTLPTDGRELFVTLQTSLDGQWVASKSTLTAAGAGAPVAAQLTSPADQSVLNGGTATFTWDAGVGVSEYWLSLGSSPAATNLYNASQGSHQSVTIAVPTDGGPLYLTLSSLINGQWHSSQYLLQAALPQ